MTVRIEGIWSLQPYSRVQLRSVHYRQGHKRVGMHHRMVARVARLVWRISKPRTIGVRAVLLDRDERVALVRHTYVDQ